MGDSTTSLEQIPALTRPSYLTEEAEQELLSFYNISTLYPDTWKDEQFGVNDAEMLQKRLTAMKSVAAVLGNNVSTFVLTNTNQLDALGLLTNSEFVKRTRQVRDKQALDINDRNFNPAVFLSKVHGTTSYQDLKNAKEALRQQLEQRQQDMASTVKLDFDRFVSAKATIDEIYKNIKSKQGAASIEHGLNELDAALQVAGKASSEIFGPFMERNSQAERLRLALGMLGRWRFFFHLPLSLETNIKRKKIDKVVRDYKKGKSLVESSAQLRGTVSGNHAVAIDNQKKVFDQVWTDVHKIVDKLRQDLFEQLGDPWAPLSQQERVMEQLMDLDSEEDPVWFYIKSQFQWIMGLLRDAYEEYVAFVHSQLKQVKQSGTVAFGRLPGDQEVSRSTFSHVLHRAKNDDVYYPGDRDVQFWQALCRLTKSLSVILNDCLPDFLQLVQTFAPGKLLNLELVENAQKMPGSIMDFYTTILQNVFFLQIPISDLASNLAVGVNSKEFDENQPSSPTSGRLQIPDNVPEIRPVPNLGAAFLFSHPITAAHFMPLLNQDLNVVAENLKELSKGESSFSDVSWVLEKIKWRGVDSLCTSTVKEIRGFFKYEDWIFEHVAVREEGLQEHTLWMEMFEDFVKFVITCLGSIINSDEEALPTFVAEQLKNLLLDSLYSALDCLEWLAVEWIPDDKGTSESRGYIERLEAARIRSVLSEPLTRNMSASLFNTAHVKQRPVDVSRKELRLLAVLANLGYLDGTIVPSLTSHITTTQISLDPLSLSDLNQATKFLNRALFDAYVKSKGAKLADVIRTGILFSGIDWGHMTRPQEVSSYAYDTLVSLALIHAEVNDVARQLVRPILEDLVTDVAQVMLDSCRKMDRFSFAGNLQAKLEIEFVEKALSSFQNSTSQQLFKLCYQYVDQVMAKEETVEDGPEMISSVKEYLIDTKEATSNLSKCLEQ